MLLVMCGESNFLLQTVDPMVSLGGSGVGGGGAGGGVKNWKFLKLPKMVRNVEKKSSAILPYVRH